MERQVDARSLDRRSSFGTLSFKGLAMRILIRAIVFLWIYSGAYQIASAQQLVLCSNCTQPYEYESAAEIAHGPRRGWESYLVVNPNTSKGMFASVVYVPPGEVPMRLERAIPRTENDPGNWIVVVPKSRKPSSTHSTMQGNGDFSTSSSGLHHGQQLQLDAIVSMSKEWVFIKPQNNSGYFNSFNDALQNMAAVDSVIRIGHTTTNPAWVNDQINGNLVASLFRALESFFGRGIGGCLLMDNGDVACWQINVLAPGAARLVEGTSKDAEGNEIPASGTLPNGSGTEVNVHPDTPHPGYVSYDWGQYQYRCGHVNGKLSHCEWIAPR